MIVIKLGVKPRSKPTINFLLGGGEWQCVTLYSFGGERLLGDNPSYILAGLVYTLYSLVYTLKPNMP